jgi:hypothetical protein
MVHAMAIDLRGLGRVAWPVLVALLGAVAASGCGPAVRPDRPPDSPTPIVKAPLRRAAATSGRQIMLGEMCPQGAAGRPAVNPIAMRTSTWTDNDTELANVIERGGVARFTVLGIDGKVAGAFDTLGLADIGTGQSVASGTYVGAGPCTSDAGKGQRAEDPKCRPATGGCGIALGELGRPDEPPHTIGFKAGGACLSGDALAVDIDGDNKPESFPFAGVLDSVRSPSQEWSAAPTASAACKPEFHVYSVKLVPQAEPGRPLDPKLIEKQTVILHVLGVVDVDGDGRMEVILELEFSTVKTILIYTAAGTAQRLELAGENTAFPR